MHDAFILNRDLVTSYEPSGKVLVDLIRRDFSQKGTTVACREGDCGACTVLVGELKGKDVFYRSKTSCISPWQHAAGKHIVTIEGLCQFEENSNQTFKLNPLQDLFREQSATQCGFCTPGFMVSLAGFLLRSEDLTLENAIASVDGNICRCTGYKSIERAISILVSKYKEHLDNEKDRLKALVNIGLIPSYFERIPSRLKDLAESMPTSRPLASPKKKSIIMGGGTDLLVQQADDIYQKKLFNTQETLNESISLKNGNLLVGAACRIEDFRTSPLVQSVIADIKELLKMFASTQIRHQGTIAGNIVNASPIGDLSNFLLAMGTHVHLDSPEGKREVPLEDFFISYKKTAKKDHEWVSYFSFETPGKNSYINLEKVSKRTYLDIASVTTSMHLKMEGNLISSAKFSAGGVAPIPMLLQKMSAFLSGKRLDPSIIKEGVHIALEEISPISDVRGSREYKRLLLRQLLFAHFLKKFPSKVSLVELTS